MLGGVVGGEEDFSWPEVLLADVQEYDPHNGKGQSVITERKSFPTLPKTGALDVSIFFLPCICFYSMCTLSCAFELKIDVERGSEIAIIEMV